MNSETGNRPAEPFDQAQGRRGTRKMEKFVGLLALCCALVFSGCASMQGGSTAEVRPNGDGVSLGINPFKVAKDGVVNGVVWVADNPGTSLGAVAAGWGIHYAGQRWLWGGKGGDNSGTVDASSKTQTDASTKTENKTKTDNHTMSTSQNATASDGSTINQTINNYYYSPTTPAAP